MIHNFPYLNNSEFLSKFDKVKLKNCSIRVNVLSFQTEELIQSIEGYVTTGSISIDGSSSMRRTANLSLIVKDPKYELINIKKLLGLNKKIEILIGFDNTTDQYTDYPILWFPQGVFIIMQLNINQTTDSISVSMSLHDKMALLNGECGGTFPASTVLHQREDIDEYGEIHITKPTIYQIILELVNHFGGEQLGKIIISDLQQRIKQVMKWGGSTPLYLFREPSVDGSNYTNQYSTSYSDQSNMSNNTLIYEYYYGDDIGYIYTEFVYPTELIMNAGDNVASALDIIKNLLGNYEYFYDVNGYFRFQEIKNNLNTTYAKNLIDSIESDDYLVDYSNGRSVYIFDDASIIQSYSNSPQIHQIKNDFLIWGVRKSVEGQQIPIRYHLAIDHKPAEGNTYQVILYTDEDDGLVKAKGFFAFNYLGLFPRPGQINTFYVAKNTDKIYKWDSQTANYVEQTDVQKVSITTKDYRTQFYLQGVINELNGTEKNYYFTELKNEWPKLYDLQNQEFFDDALKDSSGIDFFLDIIDVSSDLSDFSVENIGRRSVIINDDTINCIFEPDCPDIILIEAGTEQTNELRDECQNKKQEYSQVPTEIYSLIAIGGTLKSAYEEMRKELYQYTNYNQQVSLTVLPIYYLEPNTRVTINNPEIEVSGDYMIKSISLPLNIDGLMNLSCVKILERI